MDVKPAPRKSSRVVDKPISYYEEEEEEEQDEAEEVAVEAKIKKVQKAGESSYEKARQQRLDENKKRMQQLNLPLLSQALKPSKRPYIKKTKVEMDVKPASRKSSRAVDKPLSYYEEEEDEQEEV